MKLGDDADEIDLDATLEKYDLTKNFLFRILVQLAKDAGVKLDEVLVDGGKDRLVLTSGGVARDFLSIFRRSIDVVLERIIRNELVRGSKIGVEDVNLAAGDQGQFKEEDFARDTSEEDQIRLRKIAVRCNARISATRASGLTIVSMPAICASVNPPTCCVDQVAT